MKRRGMTLIEVMIASAIMVSVLAAVYLVLFSSTKMTESELSLRNAQFQLQDRMNRIWEEMRESSQALIRLQDFTDSSMPSGKQTVVAMVSARNATDQFQVQYAQPVWQKLVVYAPYYNPTLKTGELRRYEVTPAPAEFTDVSVTPVLSVDSTTLNLGSTSIARNGGERVCMNFDYLLASRKYEPSQTTYPPPWAQDQPWIWMRLSVMKEAVVVAESVDLLSGVKGRN